MANTPTDMLPGSWITGLSETAGTVSFSISNVALLDAGELDAASGDIRKAMYAICDELYNAYANMDSGDLPAKMTIKRVQSVNNTTDLITKTYTFQFVCDQSGVEVDDE